VILGQLIGPAGDPPSRGGDAVSMTTENKKSEELPAAAPVVPTVAPSPSSKSSWLRTLVISVCIVGGLLVGGVGGFLVAHSVTGPRVPIGMEMVGPGQGNQRGEPPQRPGLEQHRPHHAPGKPDGSRERPNLAPPTDGSTTEADETAPDEE
jgi:hypothetical protein